ncbi:MAG TPA: thioredoxin domain-containing protein [Candidatus Omnitrophota bacterium]|nr:thioredoxin domain-containing protein [Candidatus Omnitrophota bacterium]
MNRKIAATVLVFVLAVCTVTATRYFFAPSGKLSADKRSVLRSKGDPGARLWVVECIDYQCQACAAASSLLEQTLKAHPNEIYLQVRFHPLMKHSYALKAAIYAECAARKGKFWAFHKILFDNQDIWSEASESEVDILFEDYARRVGIPAHVTKACVDNPAIKETVLAEVASQKEAGVRITPSFFVNGDLVTGFFEMKDRLDREFGRGEER